MTETEKPKNTETKDEAGQQRADTKYFYLIYLTKDLAFRNAGHFNAQ